jgi:tetratricopeptide (TPR) repeat protein
MKYLLILSFIIGSICLQSCSSSDKKVKTTDAGQELNALNEAISKNDKDPELYHQRAEYYITQLKLKEAQSDLKKASELAPENVKAHLMMARIYVMLGKPQQALDELNTVNSIEPSNIQAFLEKAKLYLVMKDYDNCAKSVEKVLELQPSNADAYYIKGVALDENNEKQKAIEAFRKSVQLNPKQYDALMQLGYSFSETNPSMAIDYFLNALKADSNSLEAMYNLGMLYQDNEKPDLALQQYSRMLEKDSANKLALYNSGYVNLVYKLNYKQGIDFFSKAIAEDSNYIDAYFNRGYCFELSGNTGKARADYEKVLKLKVNDEKAVKGLNRIDKTTKKLK